MSTILYKKEDGALACVDGRKRIRFARDAGEEHVPATIRDYSDENEAKIERLVTNAHRSEMNHASRVVAAIEYINLHKNTEKGDSDDGNSSKMKNDVWNKAAKLFKVSTGYIWHIPE